MTGDIEDKSKFDNTQSILMELLKRDNKANKYENSKILDMDVSKRGLANKTDERDLDDKGMNLMIQESPLKFDELEDDITYISSRIETNRKFHNTTIDAIHSTRKSKKLEDEPLKIMQTIKKNKSNNLSAFKENSDIKDAKLKNEPIIECDEEHETKQLSNNLENHKISKSSNWRNSLTYRKSSSNSQRSKVQKNEKRRQSSDYQLKTHRPNESEKFSKPHRLIEEIKSQGKKRPSSAQNNQTKNKLDLIKIKASLKLLHKSMKKSQNSNSFIKGNQTEPPTPKDRKELELPLPVVHEHPPVPTSSKAIHRRKVNKIPNELDSMTQNNSTQVLIQSPKRHTVHDLNQSIPKLRHMMNPKRTIIRGLCKPGSNQIYDDSLDQSSMIHNLQNKENEHEKSIFERSTFDEFTYNKFKQMYDPKYNQLEMFEKKITQKEKQEKNKFKIQYKQKKISKQDYNRKIIKVEKWVSFNKKQIEDKKQKYDKNIMMMYKNLKNQDDELEMLKKKISEPIDIRTARNNMSSYVVDTSLESIIVEKYEASDYKLGRRAKVSLLKNAHNSSHTRDIDYLGNSNASILNSTHKNDSKIEPVLTKKN